VRLSTVNLGAEGSGKLHTEVSEPAEPGHGDPGARPDPGGSQGFPHGDPGAHQRGGSGRVEPVGQVVGELLAQHVLAAVAALGHRAVDAVGATVGADGPLVAEVLLTRLAHRAGPAGVDDRTDRDPITRGEAGDRGADGHDRAGELVAGNQVLGGLVHQAVNRVQVAVADTAIVDAHRDVVDSQVAALEPNALQRGGAVSALPAGGDAHGTSKTDYLVCHPLSRTESPKQTDSSVC
jgi:hypothetical protein